MSDLVLNFRVAGDGQALSVLRSFKSAAMDVGRAFDKAGKAGHTSANETARAWSVSQRPLNETERLAMKVARDQVRASRMAADAQVRDAYRVAREKQRAADQAARTHERSLRRQAQFEQRLSHQRQMRETRMAHRLQRVRDAQRTDLLGGAVGLGGRLLGAAAGGVAGLALGAGAAIVGASGAALRTGVQNRDAARALARQADGAATGDQLLSEAQGTSRKVRGVSTKDVLAGTSAFVTETGDLDFGRKIQQALAEVALASGADTTDVARDAAALYTNFGVRDAEGMRKALAGQIVQGKRGAFELKDAAQYLPSMAASAAAFDIGKGSNAVARLGGLTQIARESTGRGATAATAVEAMFRQLTAKAPELAKQGVKLTNKDGSRRDIFEVLAETVAKVTDKKALAQGVSARDAKNKGLQNIFGEEGIRAIKPLIATYGEAMAKGEDGMQALRDKMNEASDTTGSLATLQRDLQSAQGDASARLSSAWENFSSQLTDRALPATMKFVERLASVDVKPLVDALGALADGLLNLLTKLGIVSDRPEGKGDFRIKSADEALTAGKLRSEQSKIIMGALENGRSLTDEEIGQLADLREQEFAAEGRREGNVRSATSAGRFMAPTTDNESDHWFLKQDPKTIIQGRVGEAFGGGITQAAANVAGGALKIEGLDQVGRESAQAAREQMTVLQAGFAQVVEALARLNITVETTGGPTAFNEVLGR